MIEEVVILGGISYFCAITQRRHSNPIEKSAKHTVWTGDTSGDTTRYDGQAILPGKGSKKVDGRGTSWESWHVLRKQNPEW